MATNHSSNDYHRAAWLVYINGLEIPVEDATASFGVWQVPTLSLTVTPHHLLRRIGAEDRMQVVVFYLDYHWDPQHPTFRLLGEFEVVGISYMNTPTRRAMQLNCLGQLAIFQQLQFFYISSVDDIAVALSAKMQTDAATISQTKVLYPFSLFYEGLATTSVPMEGGETLATGTPIKRPVEFVLNLFRAILSTVGTDDKQLTATYKVATPSTDPTTPVNYNVTLPPNAGSVPGKNFFARWMQMTKFYQRWLGFPGVDEKLEGAFPLIKATVDQQIIDTLQTRVGESVGNSGTAWDLLQLVLGYMYMEVLSVPAPAALESSAETHLATGLAAHPVTANTRIATHYIKPAFYFALPPVCNVFYPSQVTSLDYYENYREMPTRLYLNEVFLTKFLMNPEQSPDAQLVKNLMITGYPRAVKERMRSVLTASADNSKNMLLFPEEFYAGPKTAQASAPAWMYMLAQDIQAAYPDVSDPVGLDGTPLDGFHKVFDSYAKYEYYRQRYSMRNGSVQMAWNPYVMPGFPGAVFDKEGAGLDIIMYISGVTHTMSARGSLATSASFSFVRSFEEFAGLQGSSTAQILSDAAAGTSGTVTRAIQSWNDVGTNPEGSPGRGKGTIVAHQRAGGENNQQKFSYTFPGDDLATWSDADVENWNKALYLTGTRSWYKFAQHDGITRTYPGLVQVMGHMASAYPGKEIKVVSGYRPAENPDKSYRYLRKGELGQHSSARAMDIVVEGVSPVELLRFLSSTVPKGLSLDIYPVTNANYVHICVKQDVTEKTVVNVKVGAGQPGAKSNGYLNDPSEWLKKAYSGEITVGGGAKAKTSSSGTAALTVTGSAGMNTGIVGDPSEEGELASETYNLPATNQSWDMFEQEPTYDIYPAEIVPELAEKYQELKAAQRHYAAFLYGNAGDARPAVFDWRKNMVGVTIQGVEVDLTGSLSALTNTSVLKPKAEIAEFYENYEAAMRYGARPACSLQDYIAIWHKNADAKAEAASLEQVTGENLAYYSAAADPGKRRGAVYPTRIYKLRQGPGADPGQAVTNMGPAPEYAPVEKFTYTPPEMAQTRDNWDERLEEYRKILLSEPGYKHPQG